MKFTPAILVLFVFCLLASCNININVPVSHAPKVTISDGAATVLLINRLDPDQLQYKREKKTTTVKNGSLIMLRSVENELNHFDHIKVIADYDHVTMAANIHHVRDSNILFTEQINNLASKYHAKYILSLENYQTGFNQDKVETVKDEKGREGKTAYYSIYAKGGWTWYDVAANKFTEISGTASKYHSSRPVISGLLAFGPAISPNADEIDDISFKAGKMLTYNFRPSEELVNREIYSQKPFKGSSKAIQQGEYEEAKILLEPLIKSLDHDIASKAYYNLAVISELSRNTNAAIDFAEISLKKKSNSLAQKLLISYGVMR